jgi:hypothetical protein
MWRKWLQLTQAFRVSAGTQAESCPQSLAAAYCVDEETEAWEAQGGFLETFQLS